MKLQNKLFSKLLLSLALVVVCLLVLPAQAEAATYEGGSVQLEADLTEDVIVSADTYLDLNGHTLTGNVTIAEGATLYAFDSATADYTADARGKIVGTVTGNLARTMNTPETNYKYLTLKEEDGSYSFHRYYLTVKTVVLVPYTVEADCASTAMNYKTVFKCNDVMAQYVTAYGVKLTGDDAVYTNHLVGARALTTGANGVNKHTTRLAGIMKSTNTTEDNAANALLVPVANAYININDGLEAEITSADVAKSLKDMILYANGLTDLSVEKAELLDRMNELFEEIIESWTTTPEEPVTGGYVQVTSADQFITGQYVLVASSGFAPTTMDDPAKSSPWILSGEPVVGNGVIAEADAAGFVWDVFVTENGAVLRDANGVVIAPKGGNNNGIKAADFYEWTWSVDENGAFVFAGIEADPVYLACNANNDHWFRGYKTTTVDGNTTTYSKAFTLYKGEGTPSDLVIPDAPELEDPDGTELSIADAIAMGAAKEHNTYTVTKYKVEGKITEVTNATYGNMKITDDAGNVLTIYGTYSADGFNRYDAMEVKPVAGDTVTIYGVVGQYNGTAQIKDGWIVEHTAAEPDPSDPSEPEPSDPPADSELSIKEAIDLGESKAHNTYTEGKYYVTGEITEVYNTQYGNMKITDGNGNILTIYGTYSADGADRYDAMEVKPVAGDTVTIYGVVGQYNGTPQIKDGWIVEHTAAESDPTDPSEPEETEPTTPSEPGTEPEGPTANGYVKVTSADEITTGKYVLVVEGGHAPTYFDNGWVLTGTPVVDNNAITEENAAGFVWELTVDGTSVKLTDANGVTIAPKGGNNNGVKSSDYSWAMTINEDGTITIAGVDSDTVFFACNTDATNGLNRFRGYKTTTVTGNTKTYKHVFTLYKEGTVAVDPETPDVPVDPNPEEPETPDVPEEPNPDVPEEPETGAAKYVKVTSADEITTGKYVLVNSNGTALTSFDGSWVQVGTATVENDAITEANAAGFIWDLAVDGTSVILTDANGKSIAPKGGNNNGIKEGAYSWDMIISDNGTVIFAGTGSDTVYLAGNTGSSSQVRGYKQTTVTGNPTSYPHTFTLYKLVEA